MAENESKNDWARRMAVSVCLIEDHDPRVDAVEAAMEAAAEMKCVRLKVLLGECHSVLNEACQNDCSPTVRDGLLDEVLEATQ